MIPSERVSRRDLVDQAAESRLLNNTIGRRGEVSRSLSAEDKLAQPLGRLDVPHHDRKWLLIPMLSAAQLLDGVGIGRVASQVVTAEALQGADLSGFERGHELPQRIGGVERRTAGIESRKPWPAIRAGGRLGVKPPIPGSPYSAAHREHILKPHIVVRPRS